MARVTRSGVQQRPTKPAAVNHTKRVKEALSYKPAKKPTHSIIDWTKHISRPEPIKKFKQPQNESKSRLLSLPAELRLKIWRCVFKSEKPLLPQGDFTAPQLYKQQLKLSSQILRSSQQVYEEGCSVLYGENTLVITTAPPSQGNVSVHSQGHGDIRLFDFRHRPCQNPKIHVTSPANLYFPRCYLEELLQYGPHYGYGYYYRSTTDHKTTLLTARRFQNLYIDASQTDINYGATDIISFTNSLRYFISDKSVTIKAPDMTDWEETDCIAWLRSFCTWRSSDVTFATTLKVSEDELQKALDIILGEEPVYDIVQQSADFAMLLNKNKISKGYYHNFRSWGLGKYEKSMAEAIHNYDKEGFEKLRLEAVKDVVSSMKAEEKAALKEARDTRDAAVARFEASCRKKVEAAKKKSANAEIALTRELWKFQSEDEY